LVQTHLLQDLAARAQLVFMVATRHTQHSKATRLNGCSQTLRNVLCQTHIQLGMANGVYRQRAA
jgi:hypothetical protein